MAEFQRFCRWCGKPFVAKRKDKQCCCGYCSSQHWKFPHLRVCVICGNHFESQYLSWKCPECAENYVEDKDKFKCKEGKERQKLLEKEKLRKKPSKRHLSSVNRKAREKNMSYGEYQAKLYLESMR